MTLILYKDGEMCADGLAIRGETIVDTNANKIFVEPNYVLGYAGHSECQTTVINWVRRTVMGEIHDKPSLPDNISIDCVLVTALGVYTFNENLFLTHCTNENIVAVGAYDATQMSRALVTTGMSLEEIMYTISSLNIYVGGEITTVKIGDLADTVI